jgi:hypothetical protein
MARLFNRSYTRDELMKYIGDISQVADARPAQLAAGRAKGVSVIDVNTGGGLCVSILPDRGMDMAWASYKGIPLSCVSKCGVVSPVYHERTGFGFLRSFTVGLLTTCGLTQIGTPCEDGGEALGLHGRISNTPAEDVSIYKEWEGDEFVMRIRGKMREGAYFAEQLTLTRDVTAVMGENRIAIHDVVRNCGYRTSPFMLLYHFNFGHPLLGPETRLYHTPASITARDDAARPGLADCETFEAPQPGYQEQVFFYDMTPQSDKVFACLYNEKLAVGVFLAYRKSQLPVFTQWKHMGEGEYVCGMEPCIVAPIGRAAARESGGLQFLKPGEERRFDIELGVVDGKDELAALRAQ